MKYKIVNYGQYWYGILNTEMKLMLRVNLDADYTKPLDEKENNVLLFKSKDEAQEYIDELVEEDTLIESFLEKIPTIEAKWDPERKAYIIPKEEYEDFDETYSLGKTLERGYLSEYNSNVLMKDENMNLRENTITNKLPASVDKFLTDMAQMYISDLSYTDINDFGDRATEADIKQLLKYKRELSQGFEETDPEVQEIFVKIRDLVKGSPDDNNHVVHESHSENTDTHSCIICGREYQGYGNNAQPVADGECCDTCNIEVVIPARMKQTKNNLNESTTQYIITGVTDDGQRKYYIEDTESWTETKSEATLYDSLDDARSKWFKITKFGRKLPDGFKRIFVPVYVAEELTSQKYTLGSDKQLTPQSPVYTKLIELATKLQENSPNGYKYIVDDCYEDYGAGMMWTTIICSDPNNSSRHWQVLSPVEWLTLANGASVDEVYELVTSDEYFLDKKKTLDEMNLRELFDTLD